MTGKTSGCGCPGTEAGSVPEASTPWGKSSPAGLSRRTVTATQEMQLDLPVVTPSFSEAGGAKANMRPFRTPSRILIKSASAFYSYL